MKNYNIEGNIDFFSELYKSLDIKEGEFKTEEDNKLCLISNEPLKDYFVKLNCGHMFNYIPLYNDIKNHKNKFNYLEGKESHLKYNEIRCPYCRNRQKELLPYYENLGLLKIHGVNFIDPNKNNKTLSQTKQCEYLIPNINYIPNNPEDNNSLSNSKFFKCTNYGYYKINDLIEGYDGEEEYFCCSHKNKKIKEYNTKIKIKLKEEAKKEKEEAKIKAKEESKKEKEEAKKKKVEDKKIKKHKNILSENVILGPSNIIHVNLNHIQCIEILKSGPKKGTPCGCKVYDSAYCKRHIKNINNSNIKEEVKEEVKEEI